MNKKMKRYEEGGEVEFETKMGPNENIGDDVRARAMAAMAARDAGETEKLAPKAEPKPKPKAKPAAKKKETSSFEGRTSPFAGKTSSFKKMAGGGVTRADGCVTKGHTKGKMIKMRNGGAC
jgi:hypothetical protein